MAGIKTREVIKGTVKGIDRAAVASERMRTSYTKTKERAEEAYQSNDASPVEYAANQIQQKTEIAVGEGAHQGNKIGHRSVEATRQNYIKAKEYVKARSAAKQTAKTVQNATQTTSQNATAANKTIKTTQQVKKTIKSTGKKTIKVSTRNVKMMNRTAGKGTKTAIKTAGNTAKATVKTTQKTVQGVKVTAKAAVKGIKAAAVALSHAIKGIIAGTKAFVAAMVAGGWIAVVTILVFCLFGAAFYFFGDTSSNTYIPVSAEVEAYTPVIQQYADQYGIGEYTMLIKAVMMQESGGRGNDPMQASESGYNTRYPRTPNGITDPNYSIECGVQALKSCLDAASVDNPVDMEHIRLALQGYNYGNGYIAWAIQKDGGYTVANAAEFSDQQAQSHGWSSYGDKQYVAHVLRYYPYGHYNYGVGNEVIVQSALAEVGQVGGQPYWSWYGFNGRVEWCACFVSWNAEQCGYIASGTIPKFSYCPTGTNWFKDRGLWQNRNYEPSAGDIIFFDWGGDGTSDHVGIVEKCEGGRIYTVEGNSGDEVKQNSYPVGYSLIYGFGVPAY